MDSAQKKVLKKLDVLDKMYKKIAILEKKRDRMGLTNEETELLVDKKVEYCASYDEIVEDVAAYLVDNLLSVKGKTALREIQKLVPWKGGMILTDLEYNEIGAKAVVLSDDDFDFMEKQLNILHSELFDAFEDFARTESGQIYCYEMARMISSGQDTDVLLVVDYLDARYREFGSILGLELENIQVLFEDEEGW